MEILTRIKNTQLNHRKAKRTVDDENLLVILEVEIKALTTLIGEVESEAKRTGKEPTNESVIAKIRKAIKASNETLQVTFSDDARREVIIELALYEALLPKQLTAEELEGAIKNIIVDEGLSGPGHMGQVMKGLKEKHAGLYDGKQASQLANKLLREA